MLNGWDSGQWKFTAIATDTQSNQDFKVISWNVPWGTLAATCTGNVTTYTYDTMKRRRKKTTTSSGSPGGPGGSAVTTNYFYDGARVIEEQDDTGTTLATYAYGLYIDEVLNMRRSGTDYYYHADDLYNVMALTDAGAAQRIIRFGCLCDALCRPVGVSQEGETHFRRSVGQRIVAVT